MTRFLFAAAVGAAAGLLAVPTARAADPRKPDPVKPLEAQLFARLLAQHQDLTYDQFRARAVKPRDYRDGLSFDPTQARHFDTLNKKFQLTADELALFKKQGLVSLDLGRRYSFAAAYYQIYADDLPVLVTTDSIMHALHKSYDEILMDLEMGVFAPTITQLLAKMHDELGRRPADKAEAEARDVDLYLTVARNLLAGAGSPTEDKDYQNKPVWDGTLKVASKLGQDAAALELLKEVQALRLKDPYASDPRDREPVRVYGGERYPDFSQFKPRGHYTKSQVLKNYFRAMMWLGRVDCGWHVLPPVDTKAVKADSDRELRDAILFCELLAATDGTKALKSMDDVIGFMVGRSDNLSVFMLRDVAAAAGVKTLDDARDAAKFKKVKDELESGKHAAQMIRSQLVISNPNDTFKVPPPSVFQVFGQRFILDSFVLSQVVFDSIIYQNQKQRRMMPAGLDVMAALGNDEALGLLEPELKKWNYSANLMASRQFVDLHPPAYWKANLYTLWLDCLRTLDDAMAKEKRFPEAMRTKAWQMKQLQTQLGSWAELRHDTILYAKQSYTARPSCEYPAGYVEPYPEFYAKVKFFAAEAGRLFAAAEFPLPAAPEGWQPAQWAKQHADRQARYVTFFRQMADTVGQLEGLAKKELAGEAFTDAEKGFIKKTVDARGGGSGPPRYDGWYPNLFFHRSECSEWAPVVADVHTDPESQTCLEVAVGDAMLGLVAVDNDGDRMVYVGPLYSYYEFRQPVGQRLTDPEWAQMISGGKTPPRPEWTKAFAAPPRKDPNPGPRPR
ncbi:MAG: hypothetical protein C0501_08300 [Isosphaera sp.]|nr:hypothetical protein [Isosphaera sp.]